MLLYNLNLIVNKNYNNFKFKGSLIFEDISIYKNKPDFFPV